MLSLEQLTQEALALPSAKRAMLVESLEFDIEPVIQAAWTDEAKRRRDEIHRGKVQPISGEEALAQVRQLLNP
jgi:hypothetical protein